MNQSKLSAERARELLVYDPETGSLTWLVAVSKKIRPGMPAGCTIEGGYRRVRVDRVLYASHRVAWLMSTGAWPVGLIDHRDGDPSNNRLSNLRDASHELNQQNHRQASRRSSTGLLGAFPKRGRFLSSIKVSGVQKHLGLFDTAEEAHQAYLTAKRQLHAGCTI